MIGIIMGLYINNYHEHRSLIKAKLQALNQVSDELNENETNLQTYYDTLKTSYSTFTYVLSKLNADFELVIAKDSLSQFIEQSKGVFEYEDSEAFHEDSLSIAGDLSLNYTSKLVLLELSDIIWDTYKQTNFMSVTSFNCLTNLEDLYNFQKEVNRVNSEWMELFLHIEETLFDKTNRESFIQNWKLMLLKQKTLLDLYESNEKMLDYCRNS